MNELEKVMRFLGEEEYQGMLVVARLQSVRRQLPLSWIQIVTIYTIFWEDSDVPVVHAFNLASHENLVVSKDTNGPLEKRFFPEMGGGPRARSTPISYKKTLFEMVPFVSLKTTSWRAWALYWDLWKNTCCKRVGLVKSTAFWRLGL